MSMQEGMFIPSFSDSRKTPHRQKQSGCQFWEPSFPVLPITLNFNNMKKIIIPIIITLFFTSCMDVIDLKVENFEPMLVLDGEINDKDEKQVLRLSLSQPYFQKVTRAKVDYAKITLSEDGVAVGT